MKGLAVLQQVVRLSRTRVVHPTKPIPVASGLARYQSSWLFGSMTTKETTIPATNNVDMSSTSPPTTTGVTAGAGEVEKFTGNAEGYTQKIVEATTPRGVAIILEQMDEQGITKSLEHYNAAIKLYGSWRDWEAVLSLLKEMKSKGVERDSGTYRAITEAYTLAEKLDSILMLIEEVKDSNDHDMCLHVYNSALYSLSKKLDWETASSLFQQMKDSGVEPDRDTYIGTIRAAIRTKMLRESLMLLDEMRSKGFDPPIDLSFKMVKLCGKQGAWGKALEVFEKIDKVSHTKSTYAILMRTAVESHEFAEAVRLFGEMEEVDGDATTGVVRGAHFKAIQSYMELGEWDLARTIFDKAKSFGVAASYDTMVYGYSKAGKSREAFEILNEMLEAGYEPKTRLPVIVFRQSVKNEDWTTVVDLHNKLQSTDKHALYTEDRYVQKVVMAHANLGKFDDIPKLYSLFEKNLQLTSGDASSDIIEDVLAVMCKQDSVDRAIELLHELSRVGFRPSVSHYNVLMLALKKKREWRSILSLAFEMKLSSIQADEISYIATMNAFFQLGQFSNVIQLFDEMNQNNIVPIGVESYRLVFVACSKLKKLDLAIQILKDTRKQGISLTSRVFNAILHMLVANKDWETVLTLFEDMGSLIPRTGAAYHSLILAYAGSRKWENVVSTFEEAKKQRPNDAPLYRLVSSVYFNAGKYADAVGLVPNAFGDEMHWRFHESWCDLSRLDASQACPAVWYYLSHHVKPESFEEYPSVSVVIQTEKAKRSEAELASVYSDIIEFLEKNGGPPVALKTKRYFLIHKDDWVQWIESDESKRFEKGTPS